LILDALELEAPATLDALELEAPATLDALELEAPATFDAASPFASSQSCLRNFNTP